LDIAVQVNRTKFSGSEGLCGSWNSGGLKDRDGNSFTSADWYKKWQVLDTENLIVTPSLGSCTASDECSARFPEGSFPCLSEKVGDGDHARLAKAVDKVNAAIDNGSGGNLISVPPLVPLLHADLRRYPFQVPRTPAELQI
jgi:hypothetical protein